MTQRWQLVLAALMALGIAVGLGAQAGGQDSGGGFGARVTAARQANAALMRQYTWDSRMDLYMDGTLKDTRIDQVKYGPDGNQQRTQINNQEFNQPRGLFRRALAEDKLAQVEQYLKGLRELVDQYTLPTTGKVVDFMSSASVQSVQAPDGTQLMMMQGNNVVVPGDTMSVWAVASTHKMRKVQIATTYQGAPANITATYKTLGSGLTFMSMAEIDVPGKSVSLQIHNYDYQSTD